MARAKGDRQTGSKFGVLLTLRGGPANIEDVAPFLRSVSGEEPTAEALQEAIVRYLTIGGGSPAAYAAERIAAALERKLNGLPEAESGGDDLRAYAVQGGESGRAEGPVEVPVAVGCHLSAPTIPDAVASLEAAGCVRIIQADLGPLESDGAIVARAEAVREAAGVQVLQAAPYITSPVVTGLLGEFATSAWDELSTCAQRAVVFAYFEDRAGSLDDVPRRTGEVIREVAENLSLPAESAPTGQAVPEQWVGTAAGDVIWAIVPVGAVERKGAAAGDRLVAAIEAAVDHGASGVEVVPVGYTVDDDATLYIIDVLAADAALSREVEFSRARTPNDSPLMVDALRAAVHAVV
jgi:protoheme ferro-lyase